ncbi:unnamed protein product [Medioppia subpectinata]|uniref:Protein kinase domain-containing protein n=1 Tax=Medioppia subpectinata TaxID=1979941 RepID=A0A7R9PTR5_9ACAR|nr:unnamed protein product [Medioppia subpectinata]CAG2100818.1 unnamed protein product [Medioppia subpectinata]
MGESRIVCEGYLGQLRALSAIGLGGYGLGGNGLGHGLGLGSGFGYGLGTCLGVRLGAHGLGLMNWGRNSKGIQDHCYHVHDIVAKGGANNKMVATDLACTLYQNDLSYCKRPTIAPTVSQQFEPSDDHGGDQPTITHITIEDTCIQLHQGQAGGRPLDQIRAADLACSLYEHDASYCNRNSMSTISVTPSKAISADNNNTNSSNTKNGFLNDHTSLIAIISISLLVLIIAILAFVFRQRLRRLPTKPGARGHFIENPEISTPFIDVHGNVNQEASDMIEANRTTTNLPNSVHNNVPSQSIPYNPALAAPQPVAPTSNNNSDNNGILNHDTHNNIVQPVVPQEVPNTSRRVINTAQNNPNNINSLTGFPDPTQSHNPTNGWGDHGANFTNVIRIAQGAYGYVYKATSLVDKVEYAIKIIYTSDTYMTEINALRQLTSDYVVKLIAHWEHNGHAFIQMQYCPYNLAQIIQLMDNTFGRIPANLNPALVQRVRRYIGCEMFIELLRGLHFMHTRQPPYMHRDLKAKNILFDPNAGSSGIFSKLCDLGQAITCRTGEVGSTVVGPPGVGTRGTMAPETHDGHYKRAGDVYSLGAFQMMITWSKRDT